MSPGGAATVAAAGRGPLTLAEVARMGLVASVAAGVLFALGVSVRVGWQEGLVCLLATSALAAASVPLVLRGSAELHEPVWLVLLSVGVGTTAKSFYVLFGPQWRTEFLLLDRQPHELMYAALLIALGLTAFSIGYLSGNLRWRIGLLDRLSADTWEPRRFAGVVGILVVVGLLSVLAFVVRQNVSIASLADLSQKRFVDDPNLPNRGGTLGYLRWGAMLIELAFYLVLAHWAASRARLLSLTGLVLGGLGLLASFFPVFVSSRQTLMFLILRTVLICLCIRGQPKLRHAVIALGVALAILGSMLALRRNQASWEGIRSHLTVGSALEITIGGRHLLDLTKTAHIVEGVPWVVDYKYGRTLVNWLAAPIPRSVWREKPPLAPGPELGPVLMQTPKTSGVPPAIVGELYLNFGVAGVLVGLLVIGALLRSMYATLRPYFPSRGVVLIFAVMTSRLAFDVIGNSVGNSLTRMVMELVPLVLALWAISLPPGSAARASPSD